MTRAKQTETDIAVRVPSELRYQSARDAAETGDFDRAIQGYAQLMLEEPDNVDYIFGYAQVLFWSNKTLSSIRFLEQARKLAPDYEDIWKLEYRARVKLNHSTPSASVEQFRQLAAERFPDAAWHHRSKETVSKRYRWEFETAREYLDNGSPDWEKVSAYFSRILTERTSLALTAKSFSRFGTTDTQFGSGGSFDVGTDWTIIGEIAVSSSPSFLPDTAIDLVFNRRFQHGWVGGARWRRRDYENASVDSFGLVTERYFGMYRVAYLLDSARLSSQQALVHALTFNFFARSGSQLGVIIAAGEEIEIVGPGQLLETDINSIAFTGSHPINEYLGFGWQLATHRQGRFYRRNAIGISISGGF